MKIFEINLSFRFVLLFFILDAYLYENLENLIKNYRKKEHLSGDRKSYLVMMMDNQGVPSDFENWKDYNATLTIVHLSENKFLDTKEKNFVSEEIPKIYCPIPVECSNSFIKEMKEKNPNFGEKTIEFGDVPDFHSPWFILNEEEAEYLLQKLEMFFK